MTEQLSGSSGLARKVMRRHPEDEILLATAMTMMTTRTREPVGWSLRRFFQRRGNVVVTDQRIFVESSFFSFFTLFWLGFIVYGAYLAYTERNPIIGIFLAVAFILVWQRRPFSLEVPVGGVEEIRFGSVQGISARGDVLAIALPERTIQLVTAKKLSDEHRAQLLSGLTSDATG